MAATAADVIATWPDESKEAAQLVVDTYGEPHEITESQLTWHKVGPWKRVVATRTFYEHAFPTQHIDAVESFIDTRNSSGPRSKAATASRPRSSRGGRGQASTQRSPAGGGRC
jgi:hypothetical protein